MTVATHCGTKTWYLTGTSATSGQVEFIEISTFPFTVGRRPEMSLSLPRSTVSSRHAELFTKDGELWLRDLNSTNGTYINGRPVSEPERVQTNDLIQFADAAYRVSADSGDDPTSTLQNVTIACDKATSLANFDRLMSERAVVPYFQPIVNLSDRLHIGYEVLGRSRLAGLERPNDMFLAASQLNLEAELSDMMRIAGIEHGRNLPKNAALYVNTHPVEIVNCGVVESLRKLRENHPEQLITLEVHECAATSPQIMRQLRESLDELNMQLAYDDFGAGQSRLVELAAVCPDVVKFDMKFIRDIDQAPPRQQQMLASLARMVREMGIVTLAEGVENESEHETLQQMGFELGQGYLYGRPAALKDNSLVESSCLMRRLV